MIPAVRRIESLSSARAAAFGGKARNLAAMARAGLPVPAAYAVSSEIATEIYRAVLAPRDLPEALLRAPGRDVTAERLDELRGRVLRAPLPHAVQDALSQVLEDLKGRGAVGIAVRSSSTHEDDEARSAAGIHETVLGVSTLDELSEALRQVISSVLTPRAMAYLRSNLGAHPAQAKHGAEPAPLGVAVVLQAMVPADVAGVLFTANPISGDPHEMLLNASYGLGTAVVDGTVSPDTWRIDKASGWIRDHVAGDKAETTRFVFGRGLLQEATSADDRARACLSDAAIERLIALGKRVEAQLGGARDIEWALASETIYLLQARPITALGKANASHARLGSAAVRSRTVWSNLNVGEALPGVATPLTWSVLSKFSDAGFRRAFAALGCSVPRDAELVGNFRGRIYLNMSEFTAIAAQVPGLSPRTILSLGGGGEIDTLELETERRGRTAFVARLPMTAARFVRENYKLAERVSVWERGFLAEKQRTLSMDLRLLSASALHRVLADVERLLDGAGLVMLNAYGNLLGTAVALRALLSTLLPEEKAGDLDRTLRSLLTGLADVDSAEPGLELLRIAELARAEPGCRDVLVAEPLPGMAAIPASKTKERLVAFLSRWGDRGTREAEIAEPRWSEDPSLVLATLRLHLLSERVETARDVEERQRKVRDASTESVLSRLPMLARPAASRLIELTQRFLRMRERLRAHVVSVLGLYRRVALDASRRIKAMEPGCGDGAAFFLTIDELHAVLVGDAHAVASLVNTRRIQFARDQALPPPPDTFIGQPPPPAALRDLVLLRGLGASAGRVTGRARLLRRTEDASRMKEGEILVTAQADVGLSPLFLAARAVVADLGGPLSHASIVARELGIPAVVNLKNAMQVIEDGDELEVDGDEGTVRILSRSSARAGEQG